MEAAKSPLWIACLSNDTDALDGILQQGAFVDETYDNCTMLWHACCHGDVTAASILIKHGANPNACDKTGTPALHMAVLSSSEQSGHSDCLMLLLKSGADPNSVTIDGKTSLHIACEKGDLATVSLLLQYKADSNAADVDGITGLHIASSNHSYDIAAILLQHNADVHAASKDGKTPLHVACERRRNFDVIMLLLHHSSDVNCKEHLGKTPIHLAIKSRCFSNAWFLVENGGHPDLTDCKGNTAMHLICLYLCIVQNCGRQQQLDIAAINIIKHIVTTGDNTHCVDRTDCDMMTPYRLWKAFVRFLENWRSTAIRGHEDLIDEVDDKMTHLFHFQLQCCAARAAVHYDVPYRDRLPVKLVLFVQHHDGKRVYNKTSGQAIHMWHE